MSKWCVILHWPAGTYTASAYEKTRYHSLTDGMCNFVEGDKPPEANIPPLGADYVRHTGGGNSWRIGHAICGMHGSVERPLYLGRYPIRRKQFEAAAVHVANYCQIYDIPVVPGRVETHAEFYKRTRRGKKKWDITALEGYTETVDPTVIGDEFRALVQAELDGREPPAPRDPWESILTAIRQFLGRINKGAYS